MQQKLQQGAKQQLRLSPQLQEAIGLLQLSTLELRSAIELFAQSNPLLEMDYEEVVPQESDNAFLKLYHLSQQPARVQMHVAHRGDDFSEENFTSTEQDENLHEHLKSQLNQQQFSWQDEIIALAIIDAINPDGYLQQSCKEIATMLRSQGLVVNQQQVEAKLLIIHSFDPCGVGARDLAECLLLQLNQRSACENSVKFAKIITNKYLNIFLDRDHNKLLKKSGLTMEEFEAALRLIKQLNPRPGSQYAPIEQNYITPDLIVCKVQGNWQLNINEQLLPSCRINDHYLVLLDRSKNSISSDYRRERLKEAKLFINSIENRQQTLVKVTQKIIDHQLSFLEHGPSALRPMTLQSIADEINMHESTVSRITTQKYLLTPHGLFELKYFFSSKLSTDNGIGASSIAIQTLIRTLISQEDRRKPLSDKVLSDIMKSQGIVVARRTIAKYREALGILTSVDRKI
jgi:RNA polymerase sigma-54 factor